MLPYSGGMFLKKTLTAKEPARGKDVAVAANGSRKLLATQIVGFFAPDLDYMKWVFTQACQ